MEGRSVPMSSSVEALDAYIKHFRRERGIPSPPPRQAPPPQPSLLSLDSISEAASCDAGVPSSDDSVWHLENQTTLRIRQELAKLAEQLKRDIGRKSHHSLAVSRSHSRRFAKKPAMARRSSSSEAAPAASGRTRSVALSPPPAPRLSSAVQTSSPPLPPTRPVTAVQQQSWHRRPQQSHRSSVVDDSLSFVSLSPPPAPSFRLSHSVQTSPPPLVAAASALPQSQLQHRQAHTHRNNAVSDSLSLVNQSVSPPPPARRSPQRRTSAIQTSPPSPLAASRPALQQQPHRSSVVDDSLSFVSLSPPPVAPFRLSHSVQTSPPPQLPVARHVTVSQQRPSHTQRSSAVHDGQSLSSFVRLSPPQSASPLRISSAVQTSPPPPPSAPDFSGQQPQAQPSQTHRSSVLNDSLSFVSLSPPPARRSPQRLSSGMQTSPPPVTPLVQQPQQPLRSSAISESFASFVSLSPPPVPSFRLSHSVQTSPSLLSQSLASKPVTLLSAPLVAAESASAGVVLTDNSSAKLADIMRRLSLLQQETRLALNMMDTFRMVDPVTPTPAADMSARLSVQPMSVAAPSLWGGVETSRFSSGSPARVRSVALQQQPPQPSLSYSARSSSAAARTLSAAMIPSSLSAAVASTPTRRSSSLPVVASDRHAAGARAATSFPPTAAVRTATTTGKVASLSTRAGDNTEAATVHTPQHQQQRQQQQQQQHSELVSPPVVPVYSERSHADTSALTADSTVDSVVDITGVSVSDSAFDAATVDHDSRLLDVSGDGSPVSVIHMSAARMDASVTASAAEGSVAVRRQSMSSRDQSRTPVEEAASDLQSAADKAAVTATTRDATPQSATGDISQAATPQDRVPQQHSESVTPQVEEQRPASLSVETTTPEDTSVYDDSVLLASPPSTAGDTRTRRFSGEHNVSVTTYTPARFGVATVTTQDFALSAASSMLSPSVDHTNVSLSPLIRQGESLLQPEWTASAEAAAAALERTLLDIDALAVTPPTPPAHPHTYAHDTAQAVARRPPRYPTGEHAAGTPSADVLEMLLSHTPAIELPTPLRDTHAEQRADDIVTWFLERTPPPQ